MQLALWKPKPLRRLASAGRGAGPSNQTGKADCKSRITAGAWRFAPGRADSQSHSGLVAGLASDSKRGRNLIGAPGPTAARASKSPSEARWQSAEAGFSPPIDASKGPDHGILGI